MPNLNCSRLFHGRLDASFRQPCDACAFGLLFGPLKQYSPFFWLYLYLVVTCVRSHLMPKVTMQTACGNGRRGSSKFS